MSGPLSHLKFQNNLHSKHSLHPVSDPKSRCGGQQKRHIYPTEYFAIPEKKKRPTLTHFGASKSVVRRSWTAWNSQISWCRDSKVVQGSVGNQNKQPRIRILLFQIMRRPVGNVAKRLGLRLSDVFPDIVTMFKLTCAWRYEKFYTMSVKTCRLNKVAGQNFFVIPTLAIDFFLSLLS